MNELPYVPYLSVQKCLNILEIAVAIFKLLSDSQDSDPLVITMYLNFCVPYLYVQHCVVCMPYMKII